MEHAAEPIQLRGGYVTFDSNLDRIYPGVAEHWSSLNYLARDLKVRGGTLAARPFRSFTHRVDQWLDQGQEGRCVEYGLCHELLARPVVVERAAVDKILADKAIYWPAQQEDQWPGGSYPGATPTYEGTSVLAGTKVAARLGFYGEYRWGLDAADLARMVGYKGPAVIGVDWYEGMYEPDADGFLHVSGNQVGGHCILVHGVKIGWSNEALDTEKSYFKLWNSWGKDWGMGGVGYLSWTDMETLIAHEGEVMLPVRRGKG